MLHPSLQMPSGNVPCPFPSHRLVLARQAILAVNNQFHTPIPKDNSHHNKHFDLGKSLSDAFPLTDGVRDESTLPW